jgi:hypothetical protein
MMNTVRRRERDAPCKRRHSSCLGDAETGDIPATGGNKDNREDPMKVDKGGYSKGKGTT